MRLQIGERFDLDQRTVPPDVRTAAGSDLLELDSRDLRATPLEERRAALTKLLARGRADLLIDERVQCARSLLRSSGPARSPLGLASGAIFLN